MYWIIPNAAADAFTHDFYHIDVRSSRSSNLMHAQPNTSGFGQMPAAWGCNVAMF